MLVLFCSDVSQAISVRKVNSTSHIAPLLTKCMNFLNVARTFLISRVSFRCEEIEVQVQEMICIRYGIEQALLMTVCVELRGIRITAKVRKGVA